MQVSTAWGVSTPRMLRVSTPLNNGAAITTDAVSRAIFSDRDSFPLTKSKDRTIAPSRLFSRLTRQMLPKDSAPDPGQVFIDGDFRSDGSKRI